MTRVDFYILDDDGADSREQLACRIAEKAYRLGHGVYIHTRNPQQAQQIDQLLWTFKQNSFVPHGIAGTCPDATAPVLIGHQREPDTQHPPRDVLINLDHDVPMFFSSFERVAELINNQPEHKASGRERFRFYRDRGYTLETHQMGAGQ